MKNNSLRKSKTQLLCNVWDVASAKAAQECGFDIIGTSSGAIASMLGYQDGEEITFSELKYIVERISKSVDLPLSIDIEGGYSRTPEIIADHIIQLQAFNIIGINIEDSIVENGQRIMLDPKQFAEILQQLNSILNLKQVNTFINVRTDSFLLKERNALEQSIDRAKLYAKAGASGVFVPCIQLREDISTLIKQISIPLNVMCMPNLPNFKLLENLGVNRISMGNFLFEKNQEALKKYLKQIQSDQSFKSIFEL
ncbi:MAG: isocitrate lyase/phosphoenolpyruvate mutase family protein [Bacteroidota bacterium]